MAHEYTFKLIPDEEKIRALAKTWKWFGRVEIDDSTLRSERPMPLGLYTIFERLAEVETGSFDLYQACRKVYSRVLNEGERAFPDAYDVLQRYGFSANCVLAQVINLNEATQHLGKRTAERFLNLAMGMGVQPRLFD